MPLQVTTSGVRTAYLYLVSLAAVIIGTIATIMLVYLFITKVVFGLDNLNSWYDSPEERCMHFLDENYHHGMPYPPFPVQYAPEPLPPIIEDDNNNAIEPAEITAQERYDRCITTETKRTEHENKVQLATRLSTALSMLIVR